MLVSYNLLNFIGDPIFIFLAVKNEDFSISKILILYPPSNPSICNRIDSD